MQDSTEQIDELIQRGLTRLENEPQKATSPEYLRVLQLVAASRPPRENRNNVIWVDDLDDLAA